MHLRSRLIGEVMSAANAALVAASSAERSVLDLCDLPSFDGFHAPDELSGVLTDVACCLLHTHSMVLLCCPVRLSHTPIYRPSAKALDNVDDVITQAHVFTKRVDEAAVAVNKAYDFVDSELSKLSSTQQRHSQAKAIRTTLANVSDRIQAAQRQLDALKDEIEDAAADHEVDDADALRSEWETALNACAGDGHFVSWFIS